MLLWLSFRLVIMLLLSIVLLLNKLLLLLLLLKLQNILLNYNKYKCCNISAVQ